MGSPEKLRTYRQVATILGVDRNELRFLIQYVIGDSARQGSARLRSLKVGRNRYIDPELYEALIGVAPGFLRGKRLYDDGPVEFTPALNPGGEGDDDETVG